MITDRIKLAEHFRDLGFKSGAEIGVADGRYSEILCRTIPDLALMMVDPWLQYEGNWRSNEYQENAYQQAVARVKDYNRAVLVRDISIAASLKVKDESLDFVFIDGVHTFDYTMEDIIAWSRKVRSGGIVSGHDYYQFKNSGVIEAVNAYVQAHRINVNLTLQGVAEHKDDQVPCWWFVKP